MHFSNAFSANSIKTRRPCVGKNERMRDEKSDLILKYRTQWEYQEVTFSFVFFFLSELLLWAWITHEMRLNYHFCIHQAPFSLAVFCW